MTQPSTPDPDPTLQLALLGELAEMAMAAARAFTGSGIASAKAEQMILGEEYFTPEVGRAKACGARDAAESLQKVYRAVRLTFRLQMTMAEIVRDIRAGAVTYLGGIAVRKDAGETPAVQDGVRDRRRLAGSSADDRDLDRRRSDGNADHLIDIERPDTLPRAPFRDTVEHICGDLGATVDWTAWRLNPPKPIDETPDVKPPGRSPPVPARPPD